MIPLSILDLAVVTQGSSARQAIQNSRDTCSKAEALGYHRFWMAEHHNMENIASSATSVLLGHIADATEKIRVGSGGIMLPNHSPLIIAEQFGTLATIHPGRVDLGLGRAPGTDQVTANAIRSDRMQQVHEFPADCAAIAEISVKR
jgi:luciferase family oxidoreductase group 1